MTAWRPARETLFTRTHAWLSTQTLLAIDGLPYVEASVETFIDGVQRTRGWLLDDSSERYFARRGALLTWAGVVLPVVALHGAANLRADAAYPLANREHPGFSPSRWLAPSPYITLTYAFLLRAGLRRTFETPMRPMFERAVAAGRSPRVPARTIDQYARLWDGNLLALSLRSIAVYAHSAGDHEAAARYLRSVAAICAELVPYQLDSTYGPNSAQTCEDVDALLRDNEERLACPERDAVDASQPASVRAVATLASAQWPTAIEWRLADLLRSEPAQALLAAVGDDLEALTLGFIYDERFSRTVYAPIGLSHPPPPSVLRAHQLAYAALVRKTGVDCDASVRLPASIPRGSQRHRELCAAEITRAEVLRTTGW